MHYVYILRSINNPDKIYTGYTTDLKSRLEAHNTGSSVFTKDYGPWKIAFYCYFEEKTKALEFEKYLKSHSGRAFKQKRFI